MNKNDHLKEQRCYKKGDIVYYLKATSNIKEGVKYQVKEATVSDIYTSGLSVYLSDDFEKSNVGDVIRPKIFSYDSLYKDLESATKDAKFLEDKENKKIRDKEKNKTIDEHRINSDEEIRIHLNNNIIIDFTYDVLKEFEYMAKEEFNVAPILITINKDFKIVAKYSKVFEGWDQLRREYHNFIFKFLSDKKYRDEYIIDGENIDFEISWL